MDFDRIKSNMKKISEYKQKNNSRCTLGVYSLIFNQNISELESWVNEVQGLGFDYMIIKPPGLGVGNISHIEPMRLEECKPSLERISKMSTHSFLVQVRWDLFKKGCTRDYDTCLGLPFMCAVDSDGSVYACNWFWGNEDFKYGNLNKNTFPEIWESRRKKEILEKVLSKDFDLSKCGACRQNSINGFLWTLKNSKNPYRFLSDFRDSLEGHNQPDHINFI